MGESAMGDEGFLRRWSRRKTESRQGGEPAPEPLPGAELQDVLPPARALSQAADPAPQADADLPSRAAGGAGDAVTSDAPRLPTMDDVAMLTLDSDYSSFVARGVDQAVRRTALKKLFADPHFNTMDRLDIYIDDYNKPSPLSGTMLASLRHAARLFESTPEAEAEAARAAAADPQDQQHPPETETR